MGDELDDELATLRARAYGVDADIHDDPDALARLHELENRRKARLTAQPEPPAETEPLSPPEAPPPSPLDEIFPEDAGASDPAWTTTTPAAPEPPEAPDPLPDAAARRPGALLTRLLAGTRGRLVAAGAVALVTVLIVVPLTLWVADSRDSPYAVLRLSDEPVETSIEYGLERDTMRRFDDFNGMQVTVGRLTDADMTCLQVSFGGTETLPGWGTGGCAPLGLPPYADVSTGINGGDSALLEGLEGVAALRFVYAGDEVRIYVVRLSDLPPEDQPEDRLGDQAVR